MPAKLLMVQGTASSAGKSVFVTALCRILRQDGYRVAPFKAQNMALNSFVSVEGGEVGRSQAVQAEAAGAELSAHMNPVLLKPEGDAYSQVVLRGHPWRRCSARDYYQLKAELWPLVLESLAWLRERYEVVVMEGAGSPAEINLRETDIVNMSVALAVEAPVLLIADIDRGGVFASLLGTLELLAPAERALVKGLVINRFRGDRSLLQPGIEMLEQRAGVPILGVIPYLRDLGIADEDSVSLEGGWKGQQAPLQVAVIALPRISNFDDFDPLRAEPDVSLRLVRTPDELGNPDLIILPGTTATVADLQSLRENGLAEAIVARADDGVAVIGICGGFQMLGGRLIDPALAESDHAETEGLGILPVDTVLSTEKHMARVRGKVLAARGMLAGAVGASFEGYEIHTGESTCEHAAFALTSGGDAAAHLDGYLSADGWLLGTCVHGLFANDGLRRALLEALAARKGVVLGQNRLVFAREHAYDRLAVAVRQHIDLAAVYRLAGLEERS